MIISKEEKVYTQAEIDIIIRQTIYRTIAEFTRELKPILSQAQKPKPFLDTDFIMNKASLCFAKFFKRTSKPQISELDRETRASMDGMLADKRLTYGEISHVLSVRHGTDIPSCDIMRYARRKEIHKKLMEAQNGKPSVGSNK